MGHTLSTAGTFRTKFRKEFRKDPENALRAFPGNFPQEYGYNSRHLRLPERFQNSLPPSTAGDASFFRIGSGEGLSELVMEFPAVLGVFLILREPKFRIEFPYVSREKRPECRRKRHSYEPLPTAMAQVLPLLIKGPENRKKEVKLPPSVPPREALYESRNANCTIASRSILDSQSPTHCHQGRS